MRVSISSRRRRSLFGGAYVFFLGRLCAKITKEKEMDTGDDTFLGVVERMVIMIYAPRLIRAEMW